MNATDDIWRPWVDGVAGGWALLREKLAGARETVEEWQGLARIGAPVEPFDGTGLLGAIVGLTAVLAGLWLVGVALVSLAALLGSLLGLGFLLTRVFGVSVELAGAPVD